MITYQKNSDLKIQMIEIQKKIDEIENEYFQSKKSFSEKIDNLKTKKNNLKKELIYLQAENAELRDNFEILAESYNKIEKELEEKTNSLNKQNEGERTDLNE